jgi:hypothetical protein
MKQPKKNEGNTDAVMLLDKAALADVREGIRQGLEQVRTGEGQDIEEFFREFEASHGLQSQKLVSSKTRSKTNSTK